MISRELYDLNHDAEIRDWVRTSTSAKLHQAKLEEWTRMCNTDRTSPHWAAVHRLNPNVVETIDTLAHDTGIRPYIIFKKHYTDGFLGWATLVKAFLIFSLARTPIESYTRYGHTPLYIEGALNISLFKEITGDQCKSFERFASILKLKQIADYDDWKFPRPPISKSQDSRIYGDYVEEDDYVRIGTNIESRQDLKSSQSIASNHGNVSEQTLSWRALPKTSETVEFKPQLMFLTCGDFQARNMVPE